MLSFDHYFENRTPEQMKFLRAVDASGTESEAVESVKRMLKSGNEELLEVIGVATIIACQRNREIEQILSDELSDYPIIRKYHEGGNEAAAICIAKNMFSKTSLLSTVR
jgi:hypothetical protein